MANSKRLKVHHEEDGPVLHYHFHGPIDTLITVTKSTGVTVSLPAFNNKDPSIGVDGFLDPVDITQKGHSQDDEDADGRHNIDLLLSKARPSLRPDEETTEDPQRTTAAPEAFMNVQQEQEESQTGRNIVAEATDGENKSPNRHDNPIICTIPRGESTHLIRSEDVLPTIELGTDEYLAKIGNLKHVLMTDANTKTGFRLYDGSPVLQPSNLDAFYPENGYSSRLLAAILGALPRSDKMFVVGGYDKMWNVLSNDIGRIWSLSKRRGHFIAICMTLDDRRPHRKKLRLSLYDPQQVTNDAHRAFATCRAMDKLDSHARKAGITRWQGIRHIGKVHLAICSEVEDGNCCGPRVLEYALQSNPYEEPAPLIPGMPLSTSTLRKGHFALLHDILEGRIPELEL